MAQVELLSGFQQFMETMSWSQDYLEGSERRKRVILREAFLQFRDREMIHSCSTELRKDQEI